MISLLVQAPSPEHCTSFYRAFGPFSELRRATRGLFSFEANDGFTWAKFARYDVAFIQRPFQVSHVQGMMMAKDAGVPLWVDFDDDLFDVPQDNPNVGHFRNADAISAMTEALKLADVITVSTEALRESFLKRVPDKRIEVIPNALSDHLIKKRGVIGKCSLPIATWRGSDTHTADLLTVAHEMIQLTDLYPEWVFRFLGFNPAFITEFMRKNSWRPVPNQQVYNYFDYMKRLGPSIHMVPLKDSAFNRAKSNIAWLEATWAGAATLAVALPEFEKPGVTTYTTNQGFLDGFDYLTDPGHRASALEQSWEYITRELALSKVNEKRQAILEELACLK